MWNEGRGGEGDLECLKKTGDFLFDLVDNMRGG